MCASHGRGNASEASEMIVEEQLDQLKDEILGKPPGYVTNLALTDKPLSDGITPEAEIILLDPEDLTLAYRRLDDPVSGDEKGEWMLGNLDDLFEEMLNWKEELETYEASEIDADFDEDDEYA
jgi:hypothetical protein